MIQILYKLIIKAHKKRAQILNSKAWFTVRHVANASLHCMKYNSFDVVQRQASCNVL